MSARPTIKVLGTGCGACRNMHNAVSRFVAREGLDADVEYVQDVDRILSYGVMATPVLVVNEKVVMVGFRGTPKIEQAICESLR